MENTGGPEIIDVHCHCFAGPEQAESVIAGLSRLRRAGVRHLAVMGLANLHLAEAEILKLIPEGFPNLGDPHFYEANELLWLAQQSESMLLPMLDTRCMTGDVASQLRDAVALGFRGIKGLYLADAGNDLGVSSVPEVFGITKQQYHDREWAIFAFAEANDLPVLYHMDVNRYGDVTRAIVEDFPRLRINFPHFGIGRKSLRPILDRYPNVFTDIAYMKPHIERDPASYREFIAHYPDRVCFGSDALLYQPEIVLEYIALVKALQMPEGLESNLLSNNPRRFLGLSGTWF